MISSKNAQCISLVLKYWREKLINDKWLNMNKEITYRKILKTTNRTHIQNIGEYLDTVKKTNGLIQ
jgi:hypothetical protein